MIEEKRFVSDNIHADGDLLRRCLEYCKTRDVEPLIIEFGDVFIEAKGKGKAFRLLKLTLLSGEEFNDGI
jgi:hypothetical protein